MEKKNKDRSGLQQPASNPNTGSSNVQDQRAADELARGRKGGQQQGNYGSRQGAGGNRGKRGNRGLG